MKVTRRWLPLLSEHTGLLLDAGVDSYGRPIYTFLHLSFVEYLCGRALAEQWRAGIIRLADYTNDARWYEVLRLMAGHIGMDESAAAATNLVHALRSLEFPHGDVLHQSLLLAAACLADDVPMSARSRQQVLDDIVALWHASLPSRLKSRLFRLLAAMRGTESAVDVIVRIMPMLEQGHAQTRSSVIELLGYLGDSSDQTLKLRLLIALHDPAVDVQRAAVRALGMLDMVADAQVLAALLAALQNPNAGVRTRAVLALGSYATTDREVTSALMRVLEQDGHDEPRRMAARSLGGSRHPGNDVLESLYTTMLNCSSTIRKEVVASFAQWDVASRAWLITTLRQALQDLVPTERRKVFEAIADISLVIRNAARDLLIEAASDETNHDLFLRVPMLRALGYLPDSNEQVQNLLLEALSDRHPKIRIEATSAIHKLAIRSQLVCVGLVQALGDGNTALRRQAAEALITFRHRTENMS